MSFVAASIEELKELEQKLEQLEREINYKLQQIEQREKPPVERWIQSEANKLFIGRGGEPVDRHTFLRMIKTWIASGELVEGVNYWEVDGTRFISTDFLKGHPKAKKLRVA